MSTGDIIAYELSAMPEKEYQAVAMYSLYRKTRDFGILERFARSFSFKVQQFAFEFVLTNDI